MLTRGVTRSCMARKEMPAATFLASLPLSKSLNAVTLARLAASTTRRPLKRGAISFCEGEAATAMYVGAYGEIKLIATGPVRCARLSGVVGPGRSSGEPAMCRVRPALVEAQAACDVLVLHAPKEPVFAESERNAKFARRMIASLSERVECLVQELDCQEIASGTQRVAAYQALHGRGNSDSGNLVLRLRTTQAQIASQLNLTTERFSRILPQLTDSGLLRVHGRTISASDPGRLEAIARTRRAGAVHCARYRSERATSPNTRSRQPAFVGTSPSVTPPVSGKKSATLRTLDPPIKTAPRASR